MSLEPRYESPLHYQKQVKELGDHLIVREIHRPVQLNLRGEPIKDFAAKVSSVLGCPVPLAPGTYSQTGDCKIFWLGPDEWFICAESDVGSLALALRSTLSGHVALTDVSGGYTSISLSGSAAVMLLKQATVYDFERWPTADQVSGRVAQTTFAKTGVMLNNCADGSFELTVRRSYADYVARWITKSLG